MKRILSFLLLAFFLYGSVGYYVVFQFQKYHVKEEVRHKIKTQVLDSDITILSFFIGSEEYKKLDWIEDHEFRYKGKLFDVVKKTIEKDGVITYYCINDRQEESLFANLDEHVENQAQQNGAKDTKNLVKKMLTEYVAPTPYFFKQFHSTALGVIENHVLISQSYQEITTPPPNSL